MSHRQNGFQIAIVVNGNEQRITNGNSVYIPFNSEYSVRVRNDNSVRAKFKLEIDGTEESEMFVIEAHSTFTIERFMSGNLNKGKKFKFVSADDSRVQNPSSAKNGSITVKLWKERIKSQPICINPIPYDWDKFYQPVPWNDPYPYTITLTNGYQSSKPVNLARRRVTTSVIPQNNTMYCANFASSNFISNNLQVSNTSDVGATIEGSQSNQSFVRVNDFDSEFYCTELSIQLYGIKQDVANMLDQVVKKTTPYCSNCGMKYSHSDNFCPSCGKKR